MTERLMNALKKTGLKVAWDISWGFSWERLTTFGLPCVHAQSQELGRAVVSSAPPLARADPPQASPDNRIRELFRLERPSKIIQSNQHCQGQH